MKKPFLILFLILTQYYSFCQSRPEVQSTDYELRTSLYLVGIGNMVGYPGSDNIVTNLFFKDLGRSAQISMEMLYQSRKRHIVFLRYGWIMFPIDYGSNGKPVREDRFIKDGSFLPDDVELLRHNLSGYSDFFHDMTLGLGYSYNFNPFTIEPFFALRAMLGQPYQLDITYKKQDRNHYFQEKYESSKHFLVLSPMVGAKINFKVSPSIGLSLEPSYTLAPASFAYQYTRRETSVPDFQSRSRERFFLSLFQLNFGAYLAISSD